MAAPLEPYWRWMLARILDAWTLYQRLRGGLLPYILITSLLTFLVLAWVL